ncbi:long-chain fatty acid transport protein [Neorhodopirellula lusitana]|uniref:Long-chain fatty acid transport protein n=1 Tax=Neorhodopirellula lusitana TaxID=445327 RepID=A0ABY1Q549_9BACT|nr:outer membrane protein transport protein [Neorhodopirellula lusitana]SMP58819.1 long-chain fatty acid transport protein [Neorhodopirellula lusitana]
MGHVLDAVGATNQSMGGAGTALPLDAMGALQWNPASITGLRHAEVGFSFAAFGPETSIESSVEAGAFGPGTPGGRLHGSTTSDVGISPIPTFAATTGRTDSPWSFGLGAFAIGGFGVDYPVSSQNPILTPQPPDGFGFGAIYSQFQLMQFCPTVARRFESGWSVGFAPTFNWATLAIDPFSAAAPNADGRYASAAHGDSAWGIGFQAGVFYESAEPGWNLGLSYKSPQWFQDFKMNGWDDTGGARQLQMDLDYPSILSIGGAYTGFQRLQIATDIRYIDYENTDGFQSAGFDANGAVTGFGWDSIWVLSSGVAIDVNDRLQWRFGYTYNQSPIDSANIFYNSPAPAIIQHHLSTGFTREVADGWMCSLAYKHGFQNTVSGKWWGSTGEVAGTRIASTLATNSLSAGLTKRF